MPFTALAGEVDRFGRFPGTPLSVIVEQRSDSLVLHSQLSHARACGDFAAAWSESPGGGVPDHVRVAAAVHDDGWAGWDTRPRLDPVRGVPYGYSAMPPEAYREIWRSGTARGWERGDAVGLLVSLHGMRFFARKTDPADRALLEDERGRQRRALEALEADSVDPADPGEPWGRWSDWIAYWDGLSLFLCGEFGPSWTARIRGAEQGLEITARREITPTVSSVHLDPFPFSQELEVEIEHRTVPRGPYPDQAAFDVAWNEAARGVRRCVLRPG